MRPIEIADEDRAAYHAAASIASNFLVTLEAAAERLAATAGIEREDLLAAGARDRRELGRARAPSARSPARSPAATSRPWPPSAPAIAERAPDLLALFDALVDATRALATGAERWSA